MDSCAEGNGAGYFSETPQWHCGSFQHHMCKRYGSCIPQGSALLTVFSFLIRLRAFVHAAAAATTATTSGANENLFFYMSTLARSLALYGIRGGKGGGKKAKGERESLCENDRDARFWFRSSREARPGEKPLFIPTLITHWL